MKITLLSRALHGITIIRDYAERLAAQFKKQIHLTHFEKVLHYQ